MTTSGDLEVGTLGYRWADPRFIDWPLPKALHHWARTAPDRPFLQWKDGKAHTYSEVFGVTQRIAGGLEALGVGFGDTVLLMLDNSIDMIEAWFGISLLGAIEVPVNTQDRGRFLEHVVRDSDASVIVIEAEYLGRLGAVLEELKTLRDVVVRGDARGVPAAFAEHGIAVHEYRELLDSRALEGPPDLVRSDLMAVLYTSGTTGPAKGIMMTYGHAALSATNLIEVMELGSEDKYYVCMPLFHSNAQLMQVLPSLMVGAQVSVWPEFTASGWLDQVRAVGATVSNTLGVMAEFIYQKNEGESGSTNTLRRVQTIPMPSHIAEGFEERFDVECIDGYGLTDAGILSFRRPDEPLVPGSAGRPLPGYELIIADPDSDEELRPGEIGEVLVRPTIPFAFMAGYWNNAEATVESWRNLWFHTGDAAYLDPDGLLHFHDRLKDSIRVRGENVSSTEVEAVLTGHPSVGECAAVAVPAEHGDDEIKVCVVADPDSDVDAEALVEYCTTRMPSFAVPRYVEFYGELPKTPTDKVRKVVLRSSGVTHQTWDRRSRDVKRFEEDDAR